MTPTASPSLLIGMTTKTKTALHQNKTDNPTRPIAPSTMAFIGVKGATGEIIMEGRRNLMEPRTTIMAIMKEYQRADCNQLWLCGRLKQYNTTELHHLTHKFTNKILLLPPHLNELPVTNNRQDPSYNLRYPLNLSLNFFPRIWYTTNHVEIDKTPFFYHDI